jgi:hypothetical protein
MRSDHLTIHIVVRSSQGDGCEPPLKQEPKLLWQPQRILRICSYPPGARTGRLDPNARRGWYRHHSWRPPPVFSWHRWRSADRTRLPVDEPHRKRSPCRNSNPSQPTRITPSTLSFTAEERRARAAVARSRRARRHRWCRGGGTTPPTRTGGGVRTAKNTPTHTRKPDEIQFIHHGSRSTRAKRDDALIQSLTSW